MNGAVMSTTADSSFGELGGALQRNEKHEVRLSNIFICLCDGESMIRD
jgi:hypothetical protein